jgi:hypothetical protein
MARNVKQETMQQAVDEGTAPAPMEAPESPPMEASDVIHGLVPPARDDAFDPPEAHHEEGAPPAARARKYLVVGGPDSVMYESQRVRMILGKVVCDATVDVELLARQGVKLQEITE